MGNTTSNTNHSRPSPVPTRRIDSPSRKHPQSHSPSPNPNHPHPSLRTKKKSLELPDLALLSLTPSNSHQGSANSSPLSSYRRPPRTTSPIPIPIPTSNNGTMNNASNTGTSPRGRQPNVKANIARETNTSNYSAELLLDQPPSTHIPVNHYHHRARGSVYLRGAPLKYNSTHSFASRAQAAPQPRMQELFAESQIEPSADPDPQEFVQETVHSTIPLALHRAEEEFVATTTDDIDENGQPIRNRPTPSFDEPKETVNVKITWHGGGKSVVLARAGDDNWKGRQPMESNNPPEDTSWSTWVSLMPGTHHIRFLVDEQWRLANDLPTAVDDEGTLANYVAVSISGLTPPQPTVVPATPAKQPVHVQVHSFWSSTTSTHGSMIDTPFASDPTGTSSKWTDQIPAGLVAAAREEEAYLAYTAAAEYDQSGYANSHQPHVPAPNIPPAPVLPRHLDKLILNTKAGQPPPSTRGPHLATPSQAHTRLGLDGPGLSDDASVLPVPSHVVLHHLSTSAIRNGVLAVGNTTRYRQKFLTTIYYKPT
ncbi:carbohydrate-binding module family 48 protein [Paxillus rubicundulus Ve08.2h10]|uniref:Carbohydrate-binding module family 48 protein n=1 Tax=Paxillus rubicundulus Ve08.2h10 TaxID=930991 RepID=A0A0D0E517_9AGAM|nr:carbohydrate-binding module family 48 protein [Paxillus rubicundulus Ve08.2h10]